MDGEYLHNPINYNCSVFEKINLLDDTQKGGRQRLYCNYIPIAKRNCKKQSKKYKTNEHLQG